MPTLDFLLHDELRPLPFASPEFLLLWSLFVALWAAMRRHEAARRLWLLTFSLYYVYRCNGLLSLVIVGATVADWLIGLELGRTAAGVRGSLRRRTWLVLGIVLNLGTLGVFKYADFFLRGVGLTVGVPIDPLDLFLPIGISFHVFQSTSYLVDVFRGTIAPARSLFDYALYLTCFPQMVAGPIVRGADLLPQLQALREPSRVEVSRGLYRIAIGIAKKALVADSIGRYTDLVFTTPSAYSGPELALGVYGYAAQIYLDFSGYSDMAIGFAAVLGLHIRENFEAPYRASNLRDFWRRWHVSLSTWLRDYLYIPLGGNRRGARRRYAALLATMLLGGLWHGAAWTFVVWGGLHGLALAVEAALVPRRPSADQPGGRPAWRTLLRWVVTFHWVAALWIVFRAPSFDLGLQLVGGLVRGWDPSRWAALWSGRWVIALLVFGSLGASMLPAQVHARCSQAFVHAPWPARGLALAAVVYGVTLAQGFAVRPFIYFQF